MTLHSTKRLMQINSKFNSKPYDYLYMHTATTYNITHATYAYDTTTGTYFVPYKHKIQTEQTYLLKEKKIHTLASRRMSRKSKCSSFLNASSTG